MNFKEKKITRSICEVPEVIQQIEDMANLENRSFSNMVMQLCHEAIIEREFKNQATKKSGE